ncbi:MAG: hypothetical protein AAGE65_09520 [Planctomycetota bacterium]
MTPFTAPEFVADALPRVGRQKDDGASLPDRVGLDRDPRTRRRAKQRRAVRCLREGAAADHIGALPDAGEDVVLVLTGRYHGFDVLTAILDLAKCPARHVTIATLGFNRAQTDTLGELLDHDRIEGMTFLASDMFAAKNGATSAYLRECLETRGQTYAVARNHMKLMLVELCDGRRIVTHGSLNLRRCNCFEQMQISQDDELFAFFAGVVGDIIREACP